MCFRIEKNNFVLNGKPFKVISGAVHYFRNLPDSWDDIFDKMVACGFNTVETYCVWNMHEKEKGKFDFSGRFDLSLFLQKAKEHGLMAIVRPGPYICAEWEFGGLPWWLITEPDMKIRCYNQAYIYYFERYLGVLFEKIRPFLITNGGNVILMQVENEYGYYGDDKRYLNELVRFYRESGIDIPLVTSDGCAKNELLDGMVDGCLPTINLGSNAKLKFGDRDKLSPNTPKMCMELWNGWFDCWGDEKHHTTSPEAYAEEFGDMLEIGSVNAYMFIGGTNFGFTNGANHGDKYMPQTTSYDYDALLTECGDVTEKYYKVREKVAQYVDKPLKPVPKDREKKAYGKVVLSENTGLLDNLDNLSEGVESEVPKVMEEYGIGYGYIVYKTTLTRDYENAKLSFEEIGDRAVIYINNRLIGVVFINEPPYEVVFSAKSGDEIAVICENMGRTNFGPKMMRKKGIVGWCFIDGKIHFGWKVYPLPMDNLEKLDFSLPTNGKAIFCKGTFEINGKPCDTFLRTDSFGKGFATLNGFNLGRFWEKGPQKTLYVPASVLKEGKNEIILFDGEHSGDDFSVEFTDKPNLG